MAGGPKKVQTPKAKRAKKKKEEDAKKAAELEAEEENEAEFQKAVLEIRVKELETLNLALKRKCDYLESQNSVYKTQLAETREEKHDLVSYLEKNLTEEKTIVKELEDRLIGMQQARTDDIKSYERKLVVKAEEFEGMKAKLERNILELQVKITSIEEFEAQKVKLNKNLEDLQTRLESERMTFRLEHEELENKMIRYRDKVKHDAIHALVSMAEDVQKAGKLCFTATVKTAIAANIKLNEELETVSNNNLSLRERLSAASNKLREAQNGIRDLAKEKAHFRKEASQYRAIIEHLVNKQVQMDEKIKSTNRVGRELNKLRELHSKCKTVAELEQLQKDELAAVRARASQVTMTARTDALLEVELRRLESIIVRTAITEKELTEARSAEEMEFLRTRFKTMLIEIYNAACQISDLSPELRSRLYVSLPSVLPYVEFR